MENNPPISPVYKRQPIHRNEKWRADFPVDEGQEHYVRRREFTKFLVLISGGFTLGQFFIAVLSLFRRVRPAPGGLLIANKNQLAVGESLVFQFPTIRDGCVLVRLAENEFVAFSNRCTHLMCPVVPRVATGSFHCPCHNGFFDIRTGRPTGGPPERPLPRILLEFSKDSIYAMSVQTPRS